MHTIFIGIITSNMNIVKTIYIYYFNILFQKLFHKIVMYFLLKITVLKV